MKKSILIVLILLLLGGCTNGPKDVDVYEGTGAVTVDTANNAPTSEIFESSEFLIATEIANNGAYDLIGQDNGVISMEYDTFYIEPEETPFSTNDYVTFTLNGRSLEYPRGERDRINLGRFHARELQSQDPSATTDIEIEACYPYETTYSQQICIDTDIFEEVENPICRNQGSYRSSGQGAPLTVSNVDVEMIPEQIREEPSQANIVDPMFDSQNYDELYEITPRVTITFENRGEGTVYRIANRFVRGSTEEACRARSSRTRHEFDFNASLATTPLDCFTETPRLERGQTEVVCEAREPVSIPQNIERSLNIEMRYLYTTGHTETITITRR